jgi:hypothetical protein
MSTKLEIEIFQAAMAQPASEQTRAQDLFNKQKAYFASDATKTYEWRIDSRTTTNVLATHRAMTSRLQCQRAPLRYLRPLQAPNSQSHSSKSG